MSSFLPFLSYSALSLVQKNEFKQISNQNAIWTKELWDKNIDIKEIWFQKIIRWEGGYCD